jgi:bifunctional non-homologous end joining protein LigD
MRDDAERRGRKVRHNWLLIKESDSEAKRGKAGDALTKDVTSVATGRTLEEIAAKSTKVWNSNRSLSENVTALSKTKKKRNAVNSEEIDSAAPVRSKMPEFVAPQLCKLREKPPSGTGWVHEVKFDGYRTQARVENGRVRLHTRNGLDWTTRFPEIASDLAELPDCMIDGEVCALDQKGGSDFGLLQLALSEKATKDLVFFAFDALFVDNVDVRSQPLASRKKLLEELLRHARGSKRLRFVPHFKATGDAILSAACKADLEGVISKRLDSPYRSGRGDSWTKSKCRAGQEVVIGGWRGTQSTLRSLLVGTHKDGKFVYMGRVGTGFSASVASDLLKRLKPLVRKTPAFADAPQARDLNWVEPRLVAEIEFENVTKDGLFRQAAFKGLRLDKPAAAVVPEVPVDKPKVRKTIMAAKSSVAVSKRSGAAEVMDVAISHPDKELWPKSKLGTAITKLDLASYMAAAAPRMLPHIEERPISVVRAPDGVNGELFFQRHKLLGTAVPMLAIKVKGQAQPYLGIDSAQALVALAQQAVLEIHPWGSAKGDPDSPERIILDLDPAPDVPFSRVIEGAQDLRARLTKLGLTPFVKTTGGKGLHVVVAIRRGASWDEAKSFAKALAVAMEKDAPDRYTTTISKHARTGKIFVDYLRNDRTSTGVAPWSPRARPGAPIAVPLPWSAVKRGLKPTEYTIATSGPLLKKADPWASLAKSARPLAPAVKKLNA